MDDRASFPSKDGSASCPLGGGRRRLRFGLRRKGESTCAVSDGDVRKAQSILEGSPAAVRCYLSHSALQWEQIRSCYMVEQTPMQEKEPKDRVAGSVSLPRNLLYRALAEIWSDEMHSHAGCRILDSPSDWIRAIDTVSGAAGYSTCHAVLNKFQYTSLYASRLRR